MKEQTSEPRPAPHGLSVDQAFAAVHSDPEGLASAEALRRLERFGENRLARRRGPGLVRLFLSQFHQPLVYILLVAAAVTALLQEWVDSGVIFGVVLINALIGLIQEANAVKAIESLARSLSVSATVLRDGAAGSVAAEILVPGDIVLLQSGDRVPADLRLFRVRDLQIDESALTGESVPVDKVIEALSEDTGLGDRANMAYSSTLVTYGTGAGLVIATGDDTELGRINRMMAETTALETPLTRKISRFSNLLLWVIIGFAAVTFAVGIRRGESALDMFMAAVALAVGAIPEGLPAALTITLAIGVRRMARRQAIVRKLPAVETLGSTTVICSDKTGTLTQNQMTVQVVHAGGERFDVSGGGYAPEGRFLRGAAVIEPGRHPALMECLKAGLLCNDSRLSAEGGPWRVEGDPTEGALLVSAHKAGLYSGEVVDEHPRLDAIPFESRHQFMATLHHVRAMDAHHVYLKGAVETVLKRCDAAFDPALNRVPLDAAAVLREVEALAATGLRVLAFARDERPDGALMNHADLETGLTFLGLQGMIDPPRPEAVAAVAACRNAGIAVKMITGDHLGTAVAIARQIGLPGADAPGAALDGQALGRLGDEGLREAAATAVVFARVAPEDKLRLVRALQSQGQVVAMTGDGVNDAPALKQADIGLAMGMTGTEVAKEAAAMVLADDNFATIEAAIAEGRGVFDNLVKFITWTLPTNLGEGLVITAAVFAGVALPILPVQILWINMSTAVLLGLMLAFEPKEPGIMRRPPRNPGQPLLTAHLGFRIVSVGFLLLAGSFGLFEWAMMQGRSTEEARTVAVNVFVFGEMFYLFNCRSLEQSALRLGFFSNRWLLAGVALMAALQALYTYWPPMNRLFGSAPMTREEWALVLASGFAIHLAVGLEKWFIRLTRRPATAEEPRPSPTKSGPEPGGAYHAISLEDCFERLGSDRGGLSGPEAQRRLAGQGPNEIDPRYRQASILGTLLRQFKSVLILILLAGIGFSVYAGHTVEAIVIGVIVLLAVLLGFVQEYRAERAMEALRKMAAPTASALRDGAWVELPAHGLVTGDVVRIQAGNRIPADLRLIEAVNLELNESSLTGESASVAKDTDPLADPAPAIGDRKNMAHAGTSVSSGRGQGLVVATGMATEFGRIVTLLQGAEDHDTPLQRSLNKLGNILAVVALLIVAAIVALGLYRGEPFHEMLLFGIALAVAVVPEALPAVVTISLAIGARRMVRRNALIRRLPAVETLGCTSVICSDKTGTLTRDEMTVRKLWVAGELLSVTGIGYEPVGRIVAKALEVPLTPPLTALLEAMVLANDASLVHAGRNRWEVQGDPTEGALLVAAAKAGFRKSELESRFPRSGEIPFTSESKCMSTLHSEHDGTLTAYTKGALEVVLGLCSHWLTAEGEVPLDEATRASIQAEAESLAAGALRVLAVARRRAADAASARSSLCFLGLVGMIDPPRPESKAAIATCERAGIEVVMITGDHPATAHAVAQELGILKEGRVVTGAELDAMGDDEFRKAVGQIEVYARVSPEHKLRVVQALQVQGRVVAMTGDGVNDAPALKQANIGIAMGITGTDVSREASDMLLTDDNFASIVAAVEEGRGIYSNIKKYLMYLLSSNIGEIGLMAGAALSGLPLPLSAVQILYVNLATDGLPALALAVDPLDRSLMRQGPRDPGRGIFTPAVVLLMLAGGLWSMGVNLGIFVWALEEGRSLQEAMTMNFVALTFIQFFKAYNFRSDRHSVFRRPFSNHWLNLAVLWEMALLGVILYVPVLQEVFGTVALGRDEWLRILAAAASIVPVLELAKWGVRRYERRASPRI